ncbi:uncharacterized protein LOC113239531 isoform X5 [Hyposmocoma kahamanoa]|uniref:uncharacterized protein LOC113239531 isoform X5 n=1 Tax=Hyposmocoma kahamanoa TaxID=1477025 RepID=UPI000E6D88E7|nr:uncharacterized protein LOC113239531 isoform X5 [Hyposmocoma kahamanoa]
MIWVEVKMAAAPATASCLNTEHGCVMFDCLAHLWDWLDPPIPQSQFQMENKKTTPATQQPLTQQHLMAHHVHPDQIYSQQPTIPSHHVPTQAGQVQPNGVMHQLLQNQYHSNMNPRSPLLENRHELYGTAHNHDYARHYGANDNYNYPQSPPRLERSDLNMDHNVNHELHNVPKGYNAEVYQDYMKRNPPKDTNQIYQNHQTMYRPNMNQYGSKPYLPFSNRLGPQSNTELLRRQYNEIQQMKLQQQMHYQNQAQMHQQQKFAERQLLLQQIHGIQPPPNLQNSIYSDGSYRDLDRYSSKNDFKEYSSPDIQKDVDRYAKNNEYKEIEKQTRQYQDSQWQSNRTESADLYRKQPEGDSCKSASPPSDYNNQSQKNNVVVVSPMKSDSSSPSVKSPSSDSRRSSGGNQALRSPVAQRIPSAPVTMSGILYKQGSDGLKVWRKRWFVLSEYCLFYYKGQEEEKLLGSVLLPSYKVSACTSEDKVLRKFAFKLEHANMRTYVLAAPDQEAMLKWVKALTMAALMQSPIEQPQKQSERAAAKTEDEDEIPGPTYANAPPKPRRSNEGYNSPSPDMYDPNYDLLKKPASHYSQGTSHTRYQEHTNYTTSPTQESTYSRSPHSPLPPHQSPAPAAMYQSKRPYDTHHLSLPLTNTVTDRLENIQPSTSSIYRSNPQSPYFDNRNRSQQQPQLQPENKQEQIYERHSQSRNPFLQDVSPQTETTPKDADLQNNSQTTVEHDRKSLYDSYSDSRQNAKSNIEQNAYNRDVYGELNLRPANRIGNTINERLLIERRTPDAYGRSVTMGLYNTQKVGDYEDVYASYAAENEYGKTHGKLLPKTPQSRDGSVNHQQLQDYAANYPQEKTFSGPSVLRRKKMQSSGIQSPMPRPHSADFLEHESRNEMLNNTMPSRNVCDPPRQPQRPKSSLDINSYYDPSSDRYYSEESYAEKMRQSAQYLQQQGLGPRNIQIPLAKYASGLAEKQLNSPYSQITNNNYETEFGVNKTSRHDVSYNSKYSDLEGLNSNWTLKEKGRESQKDYLKRSGSVMSDGSTFSGVTKEISRCDANEFMRSASARLPSSATEGQGEKKVQQREESMKRLLEWKQRMLQSPLTRKSTPAAISLARSLNQNRQSLRSDQYKHKTYTNASYNSYSSDDEASMSVSTNVELSTNNLSNQQPLSKKSFLGSNTSIGRNNRDANIPVRAVSPRVRWTEDKHIGEHESHYEYELASQVLPPGHYQSVEPLYVDTRAGSNDVTSPLNSEDMQHSAFGNLSNVEKQEIKTVRIVKRESERRQRDRERSLQPMSDWPSNNLSLQPMSDWSSNNTTTNLDQFLEEELGQSSNYARSSSLPRTDFSEFKEYYSRPSDRDPPNYLRLDKNLELSPKFPSSPSLSNYDYSRDLSTMSSSYHKSYDNSDLRSGYDRTISLSNQYLSSPSDSAKTLTNDPISKTSSVMSLTRCPMELSPIFKSEAAKQIITEMSEPKNGSLHRRQVPKEKRRHYTAPHHLSAKTLSEMPKDVYNHDKMGRSLDDADMERALRAAPAPDVVRSALPTTRYADSIDQLLAAPQKILIPERYIPEKPPELSPEEQQKRQEKVESIKKMLSSSSADPSKSPDGEEKRHREHLLQMNQILAKQVTEMSKIIAVKALEELPVQGGRTDLDDRSPDVELPIYQQRENYYS